MEHNAEYRKARISRDPRFDGRFFIAVKTTGIFCRPICPARTPAENNVEYYQRAEQALESGYRPCIRCRPDSAPASWAWLGTQTTVLRAAQLLTEDPSQSLTALSARLGIGERHLRSLFQEHMGLSPKHFQLSQRLLFAKQLLQGSSLPISSVAEAAGFNSTRSLQQHFLQRMKLSPLQLRKLDTTPQSDIQLKLYYRPPYNWSFVRDFLKKRALPLLETVTDHSYSKAFNLENCEGSFIAVHNPEKNCFDVAINTDNLKQLKQIVNSIRRVLDLDADPLMISRCLTEAGLKKNQQTHGIRIPGVWSVFEAGCRAICGQQVSVTAAVNQTQKIVEHLGKAPKGHYRFPSPAIVARSDLAFLGMPQARRNSLRDFARCLASKTEINPADWLAIKGIGPWTVDYVRLRGLSDPDIWLENDLVIRKSVESMALDADRAAPWRSYLTMQIWSKA